jgi:hypothetical protein
MRVALLGLDRLDTLRLTAKLPARQGPIIY